MTWSKVAPTEASAAFKFWNASSICSRALPPILPDLSMPSWQNKPGVPARSLRRHGYSQAAWRWRPDSKSEGGLACQCPPGLWCEGLFVLELRRPFLDEGRHAFLLVAGREQRMKHPPLETHALGL